MRGLREWAVFWVLVVAIAALVIGVGLGISHQHNFRTYITSDGRVCVQELKAWNNEVIREVCK